MANPSQREPFGTERFRLWLVGQGYARDTYTNHLAVFSQWSRWCAANGVEPESASSEDIERWVEERRQGRSPATIRNNILSTRTYYCFLIAKGVRPDNPTEGMRLPKVHLRPINPYTEEELRTLVEVAGNPRARAMILLLVGGGMRINELLGIRLENIDWEAETIKIERGKGNKPRMVAPGTAALKALRVYLGTRGNSIWAGEMGQDMTRSGLQTWFRRLTEKAGLDRSDLHGIRHTFASRFLDNGGQEGELQMILGHSSLAMTLHYAAHGREKRALRAQRARNPADQIFGEKGTS